MRRLFAAAALAPLAFAAQGAFAQTSVSTATTTPLATSAAGNIDITTAGSVTVPQDAAITVDSNNTVTNAGTISVRDSTAGTGVLVTGGRTGAITTSGSIIADDSKVATDADKDGDLDGAFVEPGVVRYGIRVTGPGPFIGDIKQTGGSITVKGNDGSAGISIEGGLTGNLDTKGTIGVIGAGSFGVHVQGPVTGNIRVGSPVGGTISVQGKDAVGVAIDGDVAGALKIDANVIVSGFRYLSRTQLPVLREKLDADDLLIGGPAVRIRGDIGGGILIDAQPANNDAADLDEDDDGVPDADELNGFITSFGSSAGLLIDGASPIVVGNVGATADTAFGLVLKGRIDGNGLFDGINALGAQIGGSGSTVNLSGGIRIAGGRITATAFQGDATALVLKSGATAATIDVDRGLISAGTETVAGASKTARALVIEQGAVVNTLNNDGDIRASVSGPTGNAVAVLDAGGQLSTITNTGVIEATVKSGVEAPATGERIALDLRANTTGVTLSQQANVDPAVTAAITGDIYLGTGATNDSVNIAAGTTSGVMSFGGGADSLTVGTAGSVTADLRKTSGAFGVNVQGSLAMTNANQVDLTSLTVGPTGQLTFTADPANANAATLLNVSGSATLAAGSKINLAFKSKLTDPTTFRLLQAGSLTSAVPDASLLNNLPLIFVGTASTTGNAVDVEVRRRTATELGLNGGRAAAYDAFYAAFDADPAVAAAVLGKSNTADFSRLYDQFLPDYSGGAFNSLATGARSVLQVQAEVPAGMASGEPRSWLQEVGVGVKHESTTDIEYQTGGFGIAGGIEKPIGETGAYGVSASFVTSEIRNAQRAVGSLLTASAISSSVYWRGQRYGLALDASVSGGYAWFKSERRIVDADPATGAQNLIRTPSADWSGGMAAARIGAAYDWDRGAFYVRPDAVLDAVYLTEGGYDETGGGPSADLHIGKRDSYEAAAELGVLVGARFGRSFRWGPELRIAYRAVLAGDEGDTEGYFLSAPGTPFVLPGLEKDDGRIVVRAALRGSGAYSNFAIEASGDLGEVYTAYMARILVRFLF
jgi:hypothetical protein